MTSKALLIILALLLTTYETSQPALAQADDRSARKIDEFGDVEYSDLIARLDNFAIQIQNEPNARGFIIAYRSRRDLPGLSNRLAYIVKHYLVKTRGIDPARIEALDGGETLCLTYELWIVPVGKTPKPRGDAHIEPLFDLTYKFDEHGYCLPTDYAESDYGCNNDESAFLDAFAAELRKQPRSRGYIVAYGQYRVNEEYTYNGNTDRQGRNYKRVYIDPPGMARRILKREKHYIVKTYGIASSRIKVIDGGYRKWRQVELWVAPPGEPAPIATPNALPKRNAKRRATNRK